MKLTPQGQPTYNLELTAEEAGWLMRYITGENIDSGRFIIWDHLDKEMRPRLYSALVEELGPPTKKK